MCKVIGFEMDLSFGSTARKYRIDFATRFSEHVYSPVAQRLGHPEASYSHEASDSQVTLPTVIQDPVGGVERIL